MAVRRVSLPLTERLSSSLRTPTVDAMRKRLGGRSTTAASAGRIVRIASTERLGVVLHDKDGISDVYTERGIVRRTANDEIVPAGGPPDEELSRVADDARVYAMLAEGQRVRYQTSASEMGEARLVEKCRYGALVERDDGAILGVGFRRLWPAIEPNRASS
jgi:hypothetical protein